MSQPLDGMIQQGLQENLPGTIIYEGDEQDSRLGAQDYGNRGSFKQQNSRHTSNIAPEKLGSRRTDKKSASQITIDSIERDIRQQILRNSYPSDNENLNSGEAENDMEDNIGDDVSEVPTVPRM